MPPPSPAGWKPPAPDACAGLRFAVLGCGNAQWRQTFQKFPRSIAESLAARGGTPLLDAGTADADGDFEAAVESWTAHLWPALDSAFTGHVPATEGEEAPAIKVDVVNFAGTATGAAPRCGTVLDQDAVPSRVRVNRNCRPPTLPAPPATSNCPCRPARAMPPAIILASFPVIPPRS